ncbi:MULTISPECIES: hypothetical protein [Bacteria]|jgi:hypothetical protein|uniref:hypothetical protein n=1 Tax=Pseudomonadati TaxID=3379134 RepID=UPI00055300F0|nr:MULTISPECIES: hypothetical protein [Bacteria]
MAYTEDLKIAKFMVRHFEKVTRVYKYIARDNIYLLYKVYPNKEYKKSALNAIMSMRDYTEFTAVYNKEDGIRTIYQILGVRN